MKIFLVLPILLLLTMLPNQIIQARPQKRSSFSDHDGLQGSREIDEVIPFVDAPQESQIVKHFQNGGLPYHPRGYAHGPFQEPHREESPRKSLDGMKMKNESTP